MSVSEEKKEIARYLADTFHGKVKVFTFGDDNNVSKIAILHAEDSPNTGEMSFSTIGLSDYDIGLVAKNKPLRIEIVGACLSKFNYFANAISTCAFNIINSNYSCSPGMIYPNVIKMYEPNIDMKHVMFVHPFLWDNELKTLHFDDKKITWLQVIPISENEYVFAEEYGVEELQTKLENSDIDILNVERDSML